METAVNICRLCPRKCGADRENTLGFCKGGDRIKIARVALHEWEEPCISYGNGSGTIFFSGCSLKCVFCQNYEISHLSKGYEISEAELENEMRRLIKMGAVNINLVNPTHYSDRIKRVLQKVKKDLNIPILYNTGGYDSVSQLRELDGLIDIYLPDIKYFSSELSEKYSGAANYFEVAVLAVTEMLSQQPLNVFDDENHLQRGVVIRHLVLPSHRADSMRILDEIKSRFGSENTIVSLMRQYFPSYRASEFSEINRRVTTLEYESVVAHARTLGFKNGYTQEKRSASEEYVPIFYEKPIAF